MMFSSSEWMTAQAPARWIIGALASMPSKDSILKPHQPAQTAEQMPSRASRSAILYDSVAWWNMVMR